MRVCLRFRTHGALRELAATTTWVAKGTAALVVALVSNGMNNLPVGLMSGCRDPATPQGKRAFVAHGITDRSRSGVPISQ